MDTAVFFSLNLPQDGAKGEQPSTRPFYRYCMSSFAVFRHHRPTNPDRVLAPDAVTNTYYRWNVIEEDHFLFELIS